MEKEQLYLMNSEFNDHMYIINTMSVFHFFKYQVYRPYRHTATTLV